MFITVRCECGQGFEVPEANAGGRAACPECGRALTVPRPAPLDELVFVRGESESSAISGNAIASLALGVLFVFACLSGVPAIMLGRQALDEIDLSGGRLRGRRLATAGIVLGMIDCLFTLVFFIHASNSPREAARRSQCVHNLKEIGIAMLSYQTAHGSLPAAAITDRNGRPLLSWRVAILPDLEASALYSQFHLDEPWNSPHNLALLDRMPPVYACPSDRSLKPAMTGYEAVVGRDTAFTPDYTRLRPRDFTDDPAVTVLVGESRRSVPWTKPEDLRFDMTLPYSGLGSRDGIHHGGFNVLFVDGSIRFLKLSIAPRILRAILTRNGNEEVDPSDLF